MLLRRLTSAGLAFTLALCPALAPALESRASEIESARKAYWEGRFEVSLAQIEKVLPSLTAKSEIRDAHFLLGLNQLALGRREFGREAFRAAVEADPSFTPSEELYPPDVVALYRDVRGERTEVREARGEDESAPRVKAGGGPSQQFDNVKLILSTGGEAKETEAVLKLEGGRLAVSSKKEGVLLKEMPYEKIKAAQYSYSRHPRWKEGIGFAVAVGVFAAPIFFMKGKKHWLTLQTAHDYALLRLDKNNYQIIILALETKAGIEVEVSGES